MGVGNGIWNAEADNLQVGGSAYAFAWLHLSVLACSDRSECRKSIVWQLWGKYPDGLQAWGTDTDGRAKNLAPLSLMRDPVCVAASLGSMGAAAALVAFL